MIGIVDLGRGNIGSVTNAVASLGGVPAVLDSPSRSMDARGLYCLASVPFSTA